MELNFNNFDVQLSIDEIFNEHPSAIKTLITILADTDKKLAEDNKNKKLFKSNLEQKEKEFNTEFPGIINDIISDVGINSNDIHIIFLDNLFDLDNEEFPFDFGIGDGFE